MGREFFRGLAATVGFSGMRVRHEQCVVKLEGVLGRAGRGVVVDALTADSADCLRPSGWVCVEALSLLEERGAQFAHATGG